MTQLLYAQPYDISATGFPFETADQYEARAAELRNAYGQRVEEFELQWIDGDEIDGALAEAWSPNQVNLRAFLDALDEWDEYQKLRFITAVGECGYSFDPDKDHPDDLDVDIYEIDSLNALAETFVEDGLIGPIPEHLTHYIDIDAIARDLSVEYSEITVAGKRLVYACR